MSGWKWVEGERKCVARRKAKWMQRVKICECDMLWGKVTFSLKGHAYQENCHAKYLSDCSDCEIQYWFHAIKVFFFFFPERLNALW